MEDKKIILDAQLEFVEDETNMAEASVSLNPYFQWVKIIVTDDQPNLNKQRIPLEEFANIIRSGVHTPIKMTYSQVSSGHKEAMGKVIGTVAQLIQEQNRVIALAALWKKERPEDVAMLKDMYEKGTPPNVSWEIAFAESQRDEQEIESLFGTSLTGMAIVSSPAYGGRTKFIAMASTEEEEDQVEELEQLKEKVAELETKLAETETKLEADQAELSELRTFKQTVEDAKAEAEKFDAIRAKFVEAQIEKDDEYFTANKELFLGMTESALDFMIQELVAFKSAQSSTNQENVKVPNLQNQTEKKLSPRELGEALRNKNLK